MATNIAATANIEGKTSYGKCTTEGVIGVENPALSGKVLRIGTLLVSNTTGSMNADAIVLVRRGGIAGASSIRLDGASSLTLDNNSGLSFTGDFTIEAFVYLTSLESYAGIIDLRSGATQTNYAFGFANWEGFYRLFWMQQGGMTFSSAPVMLGRWMHVAVVRSGSSIRFYIDGVRDEAVITNSSTITANATTPLIGRLIDGQGYRLNGFLEELRVSNIARYSGETFPVPASPFADNHQNSTLLLHGDGENGSQVFTDSVLNPHQVSAVGGARITTSQSVFIGQETKLAHAISVPAGATLAVVARDCPIYLEEGDRIVCLASTNERLQYAISYEEIA